MFNLAAALTLAFIQAPGQAPVNTTCPISGKAVTAASPTVTIDGSDVAVCCARCQAKINGMDEAGRKAILAKYAPATPAAPSQEVALANVYLLPTCPISDEGIDDMGAAATKVIGGREIMVCCAPCFKKIEANQDKYNARINAQIIKRQLKTYPLDTCVISGRPLGESPINLVIGNRLVRVCCPRCETAFKKTPAEHLKTLDAAMIAKTPAKPDATCIVSGRPLGASPKAVVIGNRVIRTCCGNCMKKVLADPRGSVAKADAASSNAPPTGV